MTSLAMYEETGHRAIEEFMMLTLHKLFPAWRDMPIKEMRSLIQAEGEESDKWSKYHESDVIAFNMMLCIENYKGYRIT